MDDLRVIPIRADAPPKPAHGAPCNGCGVCCLAAPCPVSALLLHHRQGPCPALEWHDADRLYRCGMLRAPSDYRRWLPRQLDGLTIRFVQRWLALGIGCDATLELEPTTLSNSSIKTES